MEVAQRQPSDADDNTISTKLTKDDTLHETYADTTRGLKYQFPSLVIFDEGKIFLRAAGTFPENEGKTE